MGPLLFYPSGRCSGAVDTVAREGMNVHAVRAVRVRRRSGTARHSLNARVNAGKRKFPQTVTYTRLRNVQPAAAPPPRGSLISCLRLLYGGLGEPRTRRARVLGSPRLSGRHRAGYSHCSCRLARPGALTYTLASLGLAELAVQMAFAAFRVLFP